LIHLGRDYFVFIPWSVLAGVAMDEAYYLVGKFGFTAANHETNDVTLLHAYLIAVSQ
jgi:hypothetical protein